MRTKIFAFFRETFRSLETLARTSESIFLVKRKHYQNVLKEKREELLVITASMAYDRDIRFVMGKSRLKSIVFLCSKMGHFVKLN